MEVNFTLEELTILSNGILCLIDNTYKAKELSYDNKVKDTLDEIINKYQTINRTLCDFCIREEARVAMRVEMKTIEERKRNAKNMNELLDHLIKLIESNDKRYSFEWASGGELATMEIFDKFKAIGYAVKIEPIKYDKDGNAINL